MKIVYSTQIESVNRRRSIQTIESLRDLSNKIIGLIKDDEYRLVAAIAVSSGTMRVHVPADLNEESLDDFFHNMATMQSHGNQHGEPCYPSIELANDGKNDDMTPHNGYLVVDVIERLVIDLVDREGRSLLRTALVQYATTNRVVV